MTKLLEATIRNTRSGLAARTAEEAFRFILHHYQFWQDNGYTHINTDKEAVERFSRKKQAETIYAYLYPTKQQMTDMERYLNIIAFNIPWPANYGESLMYIIR